MFLPKLKVVLGSKSPRRKALLKDLGLQVRVAPVEVEETYPKGLTPKEIVSFLACKKSAAFGALASDEVLITSDTLVCFEDKILGKPMDRIEAFDMLRLLSGNKHTVLTGVAINAFGTKKVQLFSKTLVTFKKLSDAEINYYLDNGNPYDKAGGYGIQDWIGMVAVKKIEGSYYNVVGLPVNKVAKALIKIHDEID